MNWKFKLFMALVICVIILTYLDLNNRKSPSYPAFKENSSTPRTGNTSNLTGELGKISQNEIIILQWTTFWGTAFPDITLNSDNCSILKTGTTQQPPISYLFDVPCKITHDHRNMNKSDAVVFHSPDVDLLPLCTSCAVPENRSVLNQIWVWFETESPPHSEIDLKKSQYQNVFNWTMSYRRDSDVYYPYGYIFQRNTSTNSNTSLESAVLDHYRKLLKIKSGLAAWIVSTCTSPSKRENFVEELQKYILVDMFGTCGKRQCPQIQDKGYFKCYNHIQSKYKFYLAFENSLCLDYITEKFYLALQTDMVPVVYGGGIDDQMDYSGVAPENSFIDARKFKSPKDLANYLIYLDENDEEYLKLFKWKAKYQVVYKDYWNLGVGWCNLCQRVFEQKQIQKRNDPSWNKLYSDLYKWWNYKNFLNSSAQFPFPPLASQSKSLVSAVGQTFEIGSEKLKPICVTVNTTDNFTAYKEYSKVT